MLDQTIKDKAIAVLRPLQSRGSGRISIRKAAKALGTAGICHCSVARDLLAKLVQERALRWSSAGDGVLLAEPPPNPPAPARTEARDIGVEANG